MGLGHPPPPKRSMTYPVLVESSPTAKPQVRSCDSPSSPVGSPMASPKSQSLKGRTASAPTFQPPVSPLASKLTSPRRTRSSSGFAMANQESRKVCEELDCFEERSLASRFRRKSFNRTESDSYEEIFRKKGTQEWETRKQRHIGNAGSALDASNGKSGTQERPR